LSFIPITALLQFTRVTNIFYLVNAILQFQPKISTSDPLITVIPVLFVVGLGMLREGLADLKRKREDDKANK